MKVTATPPADRNVTITMTEAEAVLLKRYLGKLTDDDIEHAVRDISDVPATAFCSMTDELYQTLVDELGMNPDTDY